MMLLKMVLQTKYEAIHETVPSVPEIYINDTSKGQKKMITSFTIEKATKNKHDNP